MDMGVWMSRETWRKKAHGGRRRETWSLRSLPEGFGTQPGPTRLFVATGGRWRGYFVLEAWSWNPADTGGPVTVIFEPRTWTVIAPRRAPPRRPRQDYTLQVPT